MLIAISESSQTLASVSIRRASYPSLAMLTFATTGRWTFENIKQLNV